MKILKQMQLGQVSLPIIVAVAAVAFGAGFFLDNIFSAKPFSCYLSLERPCYERKLPSRMYVKILEMGSGVGEKSFNACIKDTSAIQGVARENSEKCNQKLYQFNIPYDEEFKYCSLRESVWRKYEGNCIPPIIIPHISDLNPKSGPIGTKVTINGQGFTPTDNYLVLGNLLGPVYIPVSFSSSNGRNITFTVPNTASLLTSCSPLAMGTNAYCDGKPLKEVTITPGVYIIMVVNSNGFERYYTEGIFTVTANNQ